MHEAAPLPSLSAARRATLGAAARRIVPQAYEGSASRVDVAVLVERRLNTLPAGLAHDFRLALDVLGSRAAALVTVGRPVPFAALPEPLQDRMLGAWAISRVPLLRTVYQAIRRLSLAVYYATPASWAGIGYLGPFHERDVAFPWEGPLPAGSTPAAEAEPVARGGPAHGSPAVARGGRERSPRGDEVAPGARLTADVVVIGSGAGGAVAAARLAEAGREVLVLEEGGWYEGTDFTERELEMGERLYADAGARSTDDLGVAMLQGRCVGGGTTVNWMIMLRTPDRVLEEWQARHGTDGMSPREMVPLFERVEREVHAALVPDDAHSPNNRLILDGARALGWHAAAGRINAQGCVRAGYCGYGCRYGAKRGGLATYLARARAAGARVVPCLRADGISLAERGGGRHPRGRTAPRKRVTATLFDRGGHTRGTVTIEAPVVVVAAGAVGTPALLQRSGLGGGGVGRYLRLHPTTAVIGRYDRDIYAAAGIPLSAVCDEFVHRDANGYGFWIECPPTQPMLAAVAGPGHGAAHREVMRDFSRLGTMIALVRDGADRDASNGEVRVDRAGRTRIRYRLGAADARHVAAAVEAAARLHLAAGARECLTLHADLCRIRTAEDAAAVRALRYGPNDIGLFSAHVNGTCRIGVDPRTSGAGPDGQRHGVPGVYICDGSLLPTAPGVNPQETIMALAELVATRIAT